MKSIGRSVLAVTFALATSVLVAAEGTGTDYITALPMSIYEDPVKSPQNSDYDTEKKMFAAHSGWYNDFEVHYYKFRIYAPGNYPEIIIPGSPSTDMPIQALHIVTSDGTLSGAMGKPIIPFYPGGDEAKTTYSDVMRIYLTTAPVGYVADTFKSVADVEASGVTPMATEHFVNIPVVPVDSTLENPDTKGTNAPISPTHVWYKGVEAWSYAFEVTSDELKVYFDSTRDDPTDPAFEITVVPTMATSAGPRGIPIWHMNQYTRGVTEGTNGGGPDPKGHRNIINLDRPDAGYSPLWQVFWVTELPLNYSADQISNADQFTEANGAKVFVAPMWVNCPNVGTVGTTKNPTKKESFELAIDRSNGDESNFLLGSDKTLIFKADMPISFFGSVDDTALDTAFDTTMTNAAGAFQYELVNKNIPATATDVIVKFKEALLGSSFEVTGVVTAMTGVPTKAPTGVVTGAPTKAPTGGAAGDVTKAPTDSAGSSVYYGGQVIVFVALAVSVLLV